MPYQAEISREHPTCFIFVLDQSGSMGDLFGGGETSLRKAEFLADVVNKTLYALVMRCTKEIVKNYYHVGIIGYGAGVGSIYGGVLKGKDLVPIAELADNPLRVETRQKKVPDGAGGLVDQQVKFPVWVEPYASGSTPMCQALQQTQQLLESWLSDPKHKMDFPPTVLHITDGESTDGDPAEIGNKLMSLSSSDGNVLVYNCHISSDRAVKVEYPSNAEMLPNQFAKTLFNVSSLLPPAFVAAGKQIGLNMSEQSRGFIFNADAASLVQFFEMGTRDPSLR